MRRFFLNISFVLLSVMYLNAQESGISFEMQYPLLFSDGANEYPENNGVLGGVLQYQITDNIPFNFGFEYKFDLFQSYKNLYDNSKVKRIGFLINNINAYSKMMFITVPELQLYVSGGFVVYKYTKGLSRSYLGYNIGGGLTYDVFDKIYLVTSFTHIQATRKGIDLEIKHKEKHQLLRVGIGLNF